MSIWFIGLLAGLVFGAVTVAVMLPLKIENKQTVLVASFISRLTIGFIIVLLDLPFAGWLSGLLLGVILSLPQAILTRSYGPILGNGAIGGALVGLLAVRH
jgi:fructose-specific phosphotransferase system IIC component